MKKLLYFDFDHGTERLLTVGMDRHALVVDFRFERRPDPTHDETNEDVVPAAVDASVSCAERAEFDGFCHAVVNAMRDTPFLLQAPDKAPFDSIPKSTYELREIPAGLPVERLKCRIPAEIVAEVLSQTQVPPRFAPIIDIPDDWKPKEFWYEGYEAGPNRRLCVRLDENARAVTFELSALDADGAGPGPPEAKAMVQFSDLAQMHGFLHAFATAMGRAGPFTSAFVLGAHAGKTGGRAYRPARIDVDRVAEICLRHVPPGVTAGQLETKIPAEIASQLCPEMKKEGSGVPEVWRPLLPRGFESN